MGYFVFSRRLFLGIFICLLVAALNNPISSGQESGVALKPGDLIVSDPNIWNSKIPSLFKIDPKTGVRQVISSGGLCWGTECVAIRYGSDGMVTDFFITHPPGIARIDPSTGVQTMMTSGGFLSSPRHMVIDRNGDLLVADYNAGIVKVDPETGNQSMVTTSPFFPYGLAIERDGNLITTASQDPMTPGSRAVYRVNPLDGAKSVLCSGPFNASPVAVAIDADGNIILTECQYYQYGTVSKINKATGQLTIISYGNYLSMPFGVDVEEDGNIVVADYITPGAWDTGKIIRINPTTGAQFLIAFGGVPLDIEVVKPPAFKFDGFFSPVDNPPTVNIIKAGQAVPIKWRLTDQSGVPISDPASFKGITSYNVSCGSFSGDAADKVDEYSAGSSGLQCLDNGYWQFNWKTPKAYAGKCRVMVLKLADGRSYIAYFKFK